MPRPPLYPWMLLGAAVGSAVASLITSGLLWTAIYLIVLLPMAIVVSLVAWSGFRISITWGPLLAAAFGAALFLLLSLFPPFGVLIAPLEYFAGLVLAIGAGVLAAHRRPREPRRPSGYLEPTEP